MTSNNLIIRYFIFCVLMKSKGLKMAQFGQVLACYE